MGLDAIALRDHRARAAGAWTPRDHMRPRCQAQTSAVSVVSASTRVDEEQPDREGCGHVHSADLTGLAPDVIMAYCKKNLNSRICNFALID